MRSLRPRREVKSAVELPVTSSALQVPIVRCISGETVKGSQIVGALVSRLYGQYCNRTIAKSQSSDLIHTNHASNSLLLFVD